MPTSCRPRSLLMLGGALACFAGYRLFRIVLGIYGFILGAMIASSIDGRSATPSAWWSRRSSAASSARWSWCSPTSSASRSSAPALGALVAHVVWSAVGGRRSAGAAVIVGVAIAGAVGAMVLQRYVIIVGTAFGGAWTIIVGALTSLAGARRPRGASATDVWILYPLTPAPGERWVAGRVDRARPGRDWPCSSRSRRARK